MKCLFLIKAHFWPHHQQSNISVSPYWKDLSLPLSVRVLLNCGVKCYEIHDFGLRHLFFSIVPLCLCICRLCPIIFLSLSFCLTLSLSLPHRFPPSLCLSLSIHLCACGAACLYVCQQHQQQHYGSERETSILLTH